MNIFTKVPGLAQQTRYVCGAFGNRSNTKFCGLSFNQICTSQEGCINRCRERHVKVRPTSVTHCSFVKENTYVVQITSILLVKPWNNIRYALTGKLICSTHTFTQIYILLVMEQIKCNFNLNVINIWKETPNSSKSCFLLASFMSFFFFFLLLVFDYYIVVLDFFFPSKLGSVLQRAFYGSSGRVRVYFDVYPYIVSQIWVLCWWIVYQSVNCLLLFLLLLIEF